MGRISIYDRWVKDKELDNILTLISGWAKDGATQKQIADNLNIAVDTLIEYNKKYPDFSDALKTGKEIADYNVENALYNSALSGNVTAMIFWLKNRKTKQWRDKPEEINSAEKVTIVDDL